VTQHAFPRLDIRHVSPDNTPLYGTITHAERNDQLVRDAGIGRVEVGRQRVRFEIVRADANVLYLLCRDVRRRPTEARS